jgi:hypothetical protein
MRVGSRWNDDVRRCKIRFLASHDGALSPQASRRARAHELAHHPVAPLVVLGCAALVTFVFLLSLQRGITFLVDEWILLDERRSWSSDVFLDPFYEHLFIGPVLVFKVLMSTVGIGPHWAYAVPLLLLHVTCVALVYVLARRRIGAWFALAPALLVLFLGASYDNLLLPIQVSFLGSIAAGLGVLVVFDSAPSRTRDVVAACLLVVSLAWSSVGLVFVAAAVVEIVRRPGWRRRIWIVAAPSLLYATWYLIFGSRGLQQDGSLPSNVPLVPQFVAESAAAAFGALSGLGLDWGRIFAALALVAAAAAGLHRRTGLRTRVLALLAALTTFWVLNGLARAHEGHPTANRYIYPAAVLLLLLGVEALRQVDLDGRWAAALSALVAVAAVGNAEVLRSAKDTHQTFSRGIRAQFAGLEVLGRANVDPAFVAGVDLAPTVDAAGYFDLADALGSPVDLRRDVLARGEPERAIADTVLARALAGSRQADWRVDPSSAAPALDGMSYGSARRAGACIRFAPKGPGGTVSFVVKDGTVRVRAGDSPVLLSMRRFGQSDHAMSTVAPKAAFGFTVPANDTAAEPWRFRAASRELFTVCSVR